MKTIYNFDEMYPFSIDMVKLGGLQILMAVYQFLNYDEEVAEEIGKLLSVASLNKDLIEDIFLTGMVNILLTFLIIMYIIIEESNNIFILMLL